MPSITGPQLISSAIGYDGELLPAVSAMTWGVKVREMRKHSTIKLARFLSIAPALASRWTVNVSPKLSQISGAADKAKELIYDNVIVHRQHFLERALLGLIDFGWSPFEVVWNGFGIEKLKPLLQDITTILATTKGEFAGFRQRQTVTGFNSHTVEPETTITGIQSLLLNQYVEGSNHYGQSDMADAESDWTSSIISDRTARKYDTKTAGAHWHIDFPVGSSPYNGAEDVDHGDIAKDILAKLSANGSIATPNGADRMLGDIDVPSALANNPAWKITLIESSGSTSSSLNERLKYLDSRIVRAFLQPERSILEGTYGTKSESETQQSVALTMVEHRHTSIIETLNKGPVGHLAELYFGAGMAKEIYLVAEPIEAEKKRWLRDLYKTILGTPDGQLVELSQIDMESLRDMADVPTLENLDADDEAAALEAARIAAKSNPQET